MANEKFKVKFGLAVGDTSATIDGSNGNIVTNGDIDVKGGNITNTTGALDIATTGGTNLSFSPASPGQTIVNSAFDVNGNITCDLINIDNITIDGNTVSSTGGTNVVIDPASGTTINEGNLIIGQPSTNVVFTSNTGGGSLSIRTGSWPTSANITLNDGANGDVVVDTDGTGKFVINAITDINGPLDVNGNITCDLANIDNIQIDGNTISSTNTDGDILITPNGTGDVDLVTDTVVVGDANATATITTNGTGNLVLNTNAGINAGTLTLANGANGNITLAPNGTGNVAFTFNNGGNLTNTRNYVAGAIRNATTQSIGDIWALNSTGPVQPFRGVSVDNSADTAKNAGYVARNYSNTAANRSRFIFERARGTAASPTAVQSGDFLGELAVTGYTSTGWINDNITAAVPGFFGFTAIENWVSNTNLGTNFSLSMAPIATTITTGGNNVQTIGSNPQALALRGDIFSIAQGKTFAFTATGSSVSGTTLTIGTLVSGTIAVGQQIQSTTNAFLNGTYIVANISGSGSGSTWTLSASQTTAGSLLIAGNTGFIGSPSSGGSVDALANLRLLRNTIQGSGGTTQIVTSSAGATLELRGDNIQLENAAGTSITGNNITYNRVYGQWEQDGPVNPVAANTSYVFPIGTAIDTNIASVGSTSRIIPGAAGKYNLQFSLQWANADNTEHTFYVWLRKNGVNVANSTGDVTCLKSARGVTGWNYIVSSANATDYWELAYQVTDIDVTFPYVAAQGTAPNDIPACPALITTLTPVGA